MIGGRRPLQGRKVGDRRVRVERPHSAYFRYTGPGMLTAKEAASAPTTPSGRAWEQVRRTLFGRRLANEEEAFERLPKKLALPIFSSDAISSSAYATEEILRVLVLAGAGALLVSLQVAIAITILLTVVSISYRQVCRAYPSGGGAYVVAKENIGQVFGLIAAAALLIDYVMTVTSATPAPECSRPRKPPRRRRRASVRAWEPIRRALFGRPLATDEEIAERLPKKKALRDLQLGRDQLVGLRHRGDRARPRPRRRGRLLLRMPIASAITILLAVVSTRYRQVWGLPDRRRRLRRRARESRARSSR